ASFDRWLAAERDRFNCNTRGLVSLQRVSPDEREYVPPGLSPRPETHAHQPLPGRSRLRVAVLPFEGNGRGRKAEREENLAFSLSHDIATGLARFRWFDVVSPISFMSKPSANFSTEDLLQRNLVDYVVDGAVIRRGRFRQIDVRLLD